MKILAPKKDGGKAQKLIPLCALAALPPLQALRALTPMLNRPSGGPDNRRPETSLQGDGSAGAQEAAAADARVCKFQFHVPGTFFASFLRSC